MLWQQLVVAVAGRSCPDFNDVVGAEAGRGASEDKSVWIRAEANHRELMEGGLFYLNLRQNIINGPQLPQSVSTPLLPLYCDRILT